jgi:hypothetical protein
MRVRARKALFGISWSYEDLAVEFAQNIGGERDLDITAAPLAVFSRPTAATPVRTNDAGATEIDAPRAEAMLMLGPVFERLNHEVFAKAHERIFACASRADILPQASPEIRGAHINVQFTSMIELAQRPPRLTRSKN